MQGFIWGAGGGRKGREISEGPGPEDHNYLYIPEHVSAEILPFVKGFERSGDARNFLL